jgi:hypothetical protein
MPHDHSKSQPAHDTSRAAAHNPNSSGISRPAVQLQALPVIQLYGNPDDEIAAALVKKGLILGMIAAENYDGAIASYKELRATLKETYSLNAEGAKGVFKRHTEAAVAYVRDVITAFNAALQVRLNECVIHYQNLSARYEPEYIVLYDQIVTKLNAGEDTTVLNGQLATKTEDHRLAFVTKEAVTGAIISFNKKANADADVAYAKDDKHSIGGTKLIALPEDTLSDTYKKNKALLLQSKSHNTQVQKTIDTPGDEPQKKDVALLLIAGSKSRKDAITALFEADLVKPVQVFTQINKHHRANVITDVVTLLQAVGLDNLIQALALINQVGAKGTISEINSFYAISKTVKGGAPTIPNLIIFLGQIEITAIKELTTFLTEAGKHAGLDAVKPVWDAAKTKNKIAVVTDLFKDGVIPVTLSASVIEIALAFVGKDKDSTAADWTKLLSVPDWSKEELIALAKAYDSNPGNVTVERWVEVAKKDATLKTKPDEVRATARLNHFANDDWYEKHNTAKLSSPKKAKKKYTQLLLALLGDTPLKDLGDISFDNIQGDFLSMLVFFNRHIASFDAVSGQGYDREGGSGKYARSDKDHPLNEQYKSLIGAQGINVATLLQPISSSLLNLQSKGDSPAPGLSNAPTGIGATSYRTGGGSVASAGLPSHNLKILQDQQHIVAASANVKKSKEALFNAPVHAVVPTKSRTLDDKGVALDSLVDKQKVALSGKIKTDARYSNFHDGMLKDRSKVTNDLSKVINTITGGNKILYAIGSENHPSLILNVPKAPGVGRAKFCYNNKFDYASTELMLPQMATDFNAAVDQDVQVTIRGSFGFQRPTITDTSDSVRLWPGYAPVESLLPGLKVLVEKLRSKAGPALGHIADLSAVASAADQPVLHVEALKTAMRHTTIALNKKIAGGAPAEKKRVYDWLRTRLVIKLQQSGILLDKAAIIFDAAFPGTEPEKKKARNKHYLVTADMTDKLQEYTMLYTAATLEPAANPNANAKKAGNFKNAGDAYESKVVSKLAAADYRIFYMDSGEQALITAGILANRFLQGADETTNNVAKSTYVSRNPYFEVGVFGGDRRSNLDKVDVDGEIVHSDLSPVITSGRTTPKSKAEIQEETRTTWQEDDGTVRDANVIPIIDITNSSIDEVRSLGDMPNNFIIVESLTKHEQLGADKFIMGRLIAVSNAMGTTVGALDNTNFLDLAQNIAGPVSNEAYNPLLSQVRANMDKALYSNDLV